MKNTMTYATFGGGCFWCLDAIFQQLNGVVDVKSGYAGGQSINPTYREVCTGASGHAEVCQIEFNPDVISYQELLEVFWTVHDPTTLNRQGNDVGTQYRSVIFYHDDEQKQMAELTMEELAPTIWDNPIVTEISKMPEFYSAENYHNDYYNQNGSNPYCSIIINPKVAKFKKNFLSKLKSNSDEI